MNGSTTLSLLRARLPVALRWAAYSAIGTLIAISVALVAFLAIGLISWSVVNRDLGVLICPVLGVAAGAVMRGPGSRLARVLGAGIGGFVACYFAMASGEAVPGGTMQWARFGGAVAAVFLPVAALVGGFIGLLSAMIRPPDISEVNTDDGRPVDQVNVDR